MVGLFWACLALGGLYALVSVVFGDLISHALDGVLDFMSLDVLKPMVLMSGVAGFGGAGVLLTEYASFGPVLTLLLSIVIAVFIAALIYFFYVKPMENSENSTGFSIYELSGKIGEVTVAVPPNGYGEVLVRVGAGNTNQIAASFERQHIASGTRVVVVEVKDDTLYVSALNDPIKGG